MDAQSENPPESRSEPVAAGLAPLDELETDEIPDSMISDFSSLTTPYCWVITEDTVAGDDGAEPSAVGKSGPGQAVAEDVTEALTAGRFFRLVDAEGRELAIGRVYDPSGGTSSRRWTIWAAEPGRAEHRIPRRRRLEGGLTQQPAPTATAGTDRNSQHRPQRPALTATASTDRRRAAYIRAAGGRRRGPSGMTVRAGPAGPWPAGRTWRWRCR